MKNVRASFKTARLYTFFKVKGNSGRPVATTVFFLCYPAGHTFSFLTRDLFLLHICFLNKTITFAPKKQETDSLFGQPQGMRTFPSSVTHIYSTSTLVHLPLSQVRDRAQGSFWRKVDLSFSRTILCLAEPFFFLTLIQLIFFVMMPISNS